MLALALAAAIVVGDGVALRAGPGRDSAQQAMLWRGDWLEVRGERRGWLKVYDHRHERPGWIALDNVRIQGLDEGNAAELRAIVGFLRDTPGAESLGIAYAALYLRVAPAPAIGSDVLTALGTMAERLARRASGPADRKQDRAVAAHLEVAESWGVHFVSVERDDRARLCYDGEAFRYVLALGTRAVGAPAAADDTARAVLALSEPDCAPPGLGLAAQQASDEARLALVEKVDPTAGTAWLGNRLRLRRAQIASGLAWTRARRGDREGAARAAEAALASLLRVDRAELADDDGPVAAEAAVRVAASRWAAERAPAAPAAGAPMLVTSPGRAGETCVAIAVAGARAPAPAPSPVRCSYGEVWAASFRAAPGGAAAAVAVQPLPGWLELWLLRRGSDGSWSVDVLPPATASPELGYVELAGWSPDGARLLLVRQARVDGILQRSFEVVAVASLAVEHQSRRWADLARYRRWAYADWVKGALALR